MTVPENTVPASIDIHAHYVDRRYLDDLIRTMRLDVETTADGKTHNLSQKAARGSDLNPMSDKDLEAKLRDAAAGWNPHHDIAPLVEAIWQLDKSNDVAKLAALTVPRA